MQAAPPPLRIDRRFRLAVFGLWAAFTLVVIVVTWVGMWVKSGIWNLENQIIWESGWFGWSFWSLLVLKIAHRHPLDRRRLGHSAGLLAAIGVAVVTVQIGVDFTIISVLGAKLQDYRFEWSRYLYVAAYKGHAYYAVYWMIVGIAHAIEYHRRYRETELISSQLETRLAQAELGRLKSQLQPHFLFNAHHAIVALMLKRENDAAIRMLTRLSDLLRSSLSRSTQQWVTVREELDTLRLYLDIQRERFRDRLAIEIEAPDEVLDAGIPHLLLQPLVENALQHGLENVTENGRLEIAVVRDDDALVCTVRDNGTGYHAAAAPASTGANGCGIGLANTRERLQQLCGARQSLTIESPAGSGCTVTIRLPYRARADAEQPVPA